MHIQMRLLSKQGGVGLIEVLIAVLVLSIGFLGIAALQAKSLSTNNSSMARTNAVISSYSILDAMRVDKANALAGAYNQTVKADSCPTGGALSATQLHNWCVELGDRLGASANTQGTILCTAVGDCQVTVQFDDSRSGVGGSSAQKIITKAML